MESKYLFLLELGVILLVAQIAGDISRKFKQPAVLGQIIAGLILGAGLLDKNILISQFGEIGVILLMFIAGLETDVHELRESIRSSSLIALGGVLFPSVFVFVALKLYLPDHNTITALFFAVISTATSVSISVQTLREINQLRSRQGTMILGAAIIDDVVGIILLTVLVSVIKPENSDAISVTMIKILGFFLLIFIAGKLAIYFLKKHDLNRFSEEHIVTWAIILCLILSFTAEELGIAAVTGAYFAGVIISMTTYKHRISHEVNKIGNILFIPVFFIGIGMDIDVRTAFTSLSVGLVVIIFSSLGKIMGSGLGAFKSGFNKEEALQIGIGMIPRAEVALIVANIGLKMEILQDKDMAATVLMVVFTTLITPSLLKWSFARNESADKVTP